MKTKQLLLFSPAYNVAEYLERDILYFADLQEVLRGYGCSLTLLVIDDHSTDHTWDTLTRFAKTFDFLRTRRNEMNVGNTTNIIAGYRWALGVADEETLIGCLDADGEHNPLAFRRHIDYIESGECDGVVGSIIYPADKMNWATLNSMRFLGAVQASMMGIIDPFYIQSPGYQLHDPRFLKTAVEILLPQYREFYEEHYGEFPQWGVHAVIDSLVSMAGSKLKSVYLECFGLPPNRSSEKLETQALAALNHQKALRAFAEHKVLVS